MLKDFTAMNFFAFVKLLGVKGENWIRFFSDNKISNMLLFILFYFIVLYAVIILFAG